MRAQRRDWRRARVAAPSALATWSKTGGKTIAFVCPLPALSLSLTRWLAHSYGPLANHLRTLGCTRNDTAFETWSSRSEAAGTEARIVDGVAEDVVKVGDGGSGRAGRLVVALPSPAPPSRP